MSQPSLFSSPITLSELESHLWEAANILRGSPVDRTEWKSYIYPPDVTHRVCLAIEEKSTWHSQYGPLLTEFGKPTLNKSLGYYVADLTGMQSSGQSAQAKSKLISSYSLLVPVRR